MTTGRSPKGPGSRPDGSSQQAVSPVPALITSAAIFARAEEIAKERFPNGTNATELAAILREACRELGLTQARRGPGIVSSPNAGRHNRLELLPDDQQEEARRICAATTAINFPNAAPCTDKGFVCYRCQDVAASAIEARRAETHSGSVHESAVAKPDAQTEKEGRNDTAE